MKFLIFILTLTFFSCNGLRTYPTLPELTIEEHRANKLIVNRKPDYGIDGKDGCVILGEISMKITNFSENSLSGEIFDSKTKKPLSNATMTLFVNQKRQTEKLYLVTKDDGSYLKEYEGQLEKISVEYIGYRNLIIDLNKQ